ncbi:MAG: FAD-dependent oxidoreductase [Candidatus Omnitrophota bacterium]|jgi:flavin-dependent dehydrogenase|nr:MAG: FAD-dependent oxidoreductase [Candidatus Omnitrophota bacterium]
MKKITAQFFLLVCLLSPSAYPKIVMESARQIPIAYDVDVVVVGGSSAGVAAAVEAARLGASVFLAAPRPYLGEDLCAPYRLWLEPDEVPSTPFTRELFREPPLVPIGGNCIPFTYTADQPSEGVHKDTEPSSMLADGEWSEPVQQSVQYNRDVNILVDLGGEKAFEMVHVLAFHSPSNYEVDQVTIFLSDDGEQWREAAVIRNDKRSYSGAAVDLFTPMKANSRYLKFFIKKKANVERMLLGEILIESTIKRERIHVQNTYAPQFGADHVRFSEGDTDDSQPETTPSSDRLTPMPMQVKYTLDQALLKAGVQFHYGCYATDILRDGNGKPAGIVMVNRSGRQAVKAKVIIDAMPRAEAARLAGVEFQPYPVGNQTFKRIVIGGEILEGLSARTMPTTIRSNMENSKFMEHPAIEYTLDIPMNDGSFASFARAEQIARDQTWHPGQVDDSEELFQMPPDPMKGKKSLTTSWPGANAVDLDVFRPATQERFYVLNGCADLPRDAAEKLLRPLTFIEIGQRIGQAAAEEARSVSALEGVHLPESRAQSAVSGDTRELLIGTRPIVKNPATIKAAERSLPVIGEYDVVVAGGGTGGAPAGIAAARQGAKTLVLEYLHGLGGVGTLGLIGIYYHGFREGFTAEIDKGVDAIGGLDYQQKRGWNIEHKMEWYRRELRKAGADIWFGVLGCGAFVEDGCVKGVIVATPEGRGVVLAKVAIDSTGSSDIAIAAGADYMFTDAEHAALQGTGLPPHQPGAYYTNTDYTYSDESDLIDTWRSFVVARELFKGAYDLGQLVDTRERRRIVGDYVQTPIDIFTQRTFPDTINLSSSNFDTHGFTVHPVVMLKPPDHRDFPAYTPYRCMLPKGLDGILVIGLGISAHRDAMPFLRMQPDIQNQGYAMGVAAAMAVKENQRTRDIDIKQLQRHLVEIGNLPESVLTDEDSFPVSKEQIAEAVRNVPIDLKGKQAISGERLPPPEFDPIALILAQPQDSLPLLSEAYQVVENQEDKLIYAQILGMMGSADGSDTLIDAIQSHEWDDQGSLYGRRQSPLDDLIIALGRTRDRRGVPAILEKLERLDAKSEFSHHRAVAIALETLADPTAARPLAELLAKPGMTGYAATDIEAARRPTRTQSLRELILARALYRCGDYEGRGEEILKQYEKDLHGHQSRHAHAILSERQRE